MESQFQIIWDTLNNGILQVIVHYMQNGILPNLQLHWMLIVVLLIKQKSSIILKWKHLNYLLPIKVGIHLWVGNMAIKLLLS